MKKFNLSFLLVLFATVVFAQPQIKFDNTTYDFGTIKEEKGKGILAAEFLLQKGFVDSIVERKNMRTCIYKILILHGVRNNG